MNMACSATVTELAVPATISGTPRSVSAATSTESKPTPKREQTSRWGVAAISSRV